MKKIKWGIAGPGIIAQKFGGGGHKKAAGVTMNGSVHDIIDNISAQIELQL